VRKGYSSIATKTVPAASSDRHGLAANSLLLNILPATSYSTIFCEQSAVYAIANHSEISTLPDSAKKKEERGIPAPARTLGRLPVI
jgi:hypothetical protein